MTSQAQCPSVHPRGVRCVEDAGHDGPHHANIDSDRAEWIVGREVPKTKRSPGGILSKAEGRVSRDD